MIFLSNNTQMLRYSFFTLNQTILIEEELNDKILETIDESLTKKFKLNKNFQMADLCFKLKTLFNK